MSQKMPKGRLAPLMPPAADQLWKPVVALALRDGEGRLLLQRRPLHKHHGGRWEFPGGKVEPGETPRMALVREIAEELAIRLDPADLTPALMAEEMAAEAGDPVIVLLLYTACVWRGAIMGMERQEWGWFADGEAAKLDLAPMDGDLLARLRGGN